jgi:RNA polymerase sigma-70 factor, ECF subfamily
MRKPEEFLSPDAWVGGAMLVQVPGLRAYAIALCRNVDRADDLVQETLLKAWANIDSFRVGSNMTAWLFTILRNQFRSEYRKRLREVVMPFDQDKDIDSCLRSAPTQSSRLQYWDVWQALWKLPTDQRDALLLVALSQLSYAEAAEICGCAVGTVKSRVNRARARLAMLLELGDAENFGPDGITCAVLGPNGSMHA